MKKNNIFTLFVITLIFILGAVFYTSQNSTKSEFFAVNEKDVIESWDFKGFYLGNENLEKQARSEIEDLKKIKPNENYNEYTHNIDLASQYYYLGDGKNAYKHLIRAIEIDPDGTSLAYGNMGSLMRDLGALETAKDAFEKAYQIQSNGFYAEKYTNFLKEYFPEELERVIEEERKAAEEAENLNLLEANI